VHQPCTPNVVAAVLANAEIFRHVREGFTHIAFLRVYAQTETVTVPGHPRAFQRVWCNDQAALFVEETWA
jgi:hypothetical protein